MTFAKSKINRIPQSYHSKNRGESEKNLYVVWSDRNIVSSVGADLFLFHFIKVMQGMVADYTLQ